MTALIPANFGAVSTKFANQQTVDDLSSGIQSSFGLIGYKGKVWSIRYRGDETPLMREDGDGAKASIEVVILASSKAVSKVWYEAGYVEGSNAAPDCFSNNGVTPDPASAKKQCDSCAMCPMNQWGSRITPAGKNGKACADSKRLAVVPAQDLANEMFGGPMLLRVPAASLQDLAMYGQKMSQLGYPYYAVSTRIAFDTNESYPKFIFGAIRPLNDAEAEVVLAERTGHTVERILSENEFATAPAPEQADVNSAFEQPPAEEQAAAPAKSTVGEQARAAAAANKARVEADKAAQAAEAKAHAVATAKTKKQQEAADKKAAEAGEGTRAATPEEIKAAKLAEARRKMAELEAELASTEEEEVTSEGNEESDEDRELREMEEKMAALKAKKQAAGTTAAPAPAKTTAPSQVAAPAPAPEEDGDMDSIVSDFEKDLDGMLDDLLPS